MFPEYGIKKIIVNRDWNYLWCCIITKWWLDHVYFHWHHHVLRERCENCRMWHYRGKLSDGLKIGWCDLHNEWDDYHAWCVAHNLDFEAEEHYTTMEDGAEDYHVTPAGRTITRIVQRGRWMYKKDGIPEWAL